MGLKYVSIDIETSGLDRQNDQVLEVGAIIEDTSKQLSFDEIPKYEAIIKYDRLSGSPYALNLNARIIRILKEIPRGENEKQDYCILYNIIKPEDFALSFHTFLTSNGYDGNKKIKIITAGKNFSSFDKPFLERMPNFTDYIDMGHRSIDPAPIYIDFMNDTEIPSSDVCMERAEINDSVTHVAIEDAWDVIRLLRKKY